MAIICSLLILERGTVKMRKLLLIIVILVGVTIFNLPPSAHALPEAQRVELEASDGLVLVGDFYMPEIATDETSELVPAVILMHMLRARRGDWEPLLPVLVDDYGIAVLNIDMRGHGETGGTDNWGIAEEDLQLWIDWLRDQEGIDPTAISLIGGSIGSNMAIRGWANDPEIRTAVALSPGLAYRSVRTREVIIENKDRPLMLVAARSDSPSSVDTPILFGLTEGDTLIRMVDGRLHGTQLLYGDDADWLMDTIGYWIVSQSE
jgi:pimeloyl-ACP methyl ester carboxylesterase